MKVQLRTASDEFGDLFLNQSASANLLIDLLHGHGPHQSKEFICKYL